MLGRIALRHAIVGVIGLSASAVRGVAQSPPAKTPSSPRVAAAGDTSKRDYRYRYRVLGVFDDQTGEPIEGVDVTDNFSGMTARTTKTGTVSLMFLPEGGSVVRLRKIGYEVMSLLVSISPADTAPLTLILRKATTLPTMAIKDSTNKYISPGLNGFEARVKRHAGGYFVDDSTLRKYDDVGHIAEVLDARLGGTIQVQYQSHIFIASQVGGSTGLHTGGLPHAVPHDQKSPRGCWVTVYRDGVRIYTPGTNQDAADFASMQVADYAGVEFYPHSSSLPMEFSSPSGNDCGVLLLWTREQ